jgi:hypothetical protein
VPADAQSQNTVLADINYVRNADGDPLTFVTEDESRSTMVTSPGEPVWIQDVRGTQTSIDREGFMLVRHVSAVSDFDRIEEDAAIDQLYIDEMTALVKEATGAPIVVMQGVGKKRYGKAAKEKLAGLKNALPALYPHGDTTETSAPQLAAAIASAIPGLSLEAIRRWAHINLWRPITAPPHDYPLAVCDARTIAPGDAVTVVAHTETRGAGAFAFETHGYIHNPAHRWCYFSDMTPGEVLIFKTHDSDPGRAHQVAHTAFLNSLCPPGASTRGSVEMRAFVAWP